MTSRRIVPALCGSLLALGLLLAGTGGAFALSGDTQGAGPQLLGSAALSAVPSTIGAADAGCSGTTLQTNVALSWVDSQSGIADAAGGSLVSGYSVGRSLSSSGPFVDASSVSGSPPSPTTLDSPVIPATAAALVVGGSGSGANSILPVAESGVAPGAAISTGNTGGEPNAVQITPDGQTAVIAERASNEVVVLGWSGTTWSPEAVLHLASPIAVAIDPVRNQAGLYVAYAVSDPGARSDGFVTPITLDQASSNLGSPVTIGRQGDPTAALVTPDGSRLYVADYGSQSISVVDTASGSVSTIVLPGRSPTPVALAVTPDSSHLYVADRANSVVDDVTVSENSVTAQVVLARRGLVDPRLRNSGDPSLLAMSPDGSTLYVAEFGAHEVQSLDTSLGSAPDTVTGSIGMGSGSGPVDLAMSPNGCTLYVAAWSSNDIFAIDTATGALATEFVAGCGVQDPQAMAVTPDNGALIVAESRGCREVQVLQAATGHVATLARIGTRPAMIAIPPVNLWYEVTATHLQWNSGHSAADSYPAGWSPGGWQ